MSTLQDDLEQYSSASGWATPQEESPSSHHSSPSGWATAHEESPSPHHSSPSGWATPRDEPGTVNASVGARDMNLEKLRSDAMKGKWSEVFETCKQNKALFKSKIMGTGDTVLHMAVSNGQEKLVANMLKFLVLEENNLTQNNVVIPVDGDEVESWSVNIVLGAENDRKYTPLHLAAVKGNVKMCKKIGRRDPSLIARRNIAGETPLFLAALYGKKEAFLWLHYLYMEDPGVSSTDLAHCISDDNDTILHCAIAEGHFDVAIEIVHLYKDHLKEMMRRNKEGLSPLHLLAAKSSAFKTTALLERSFLVHRIYGCLKVKEKNQATTHEELQKKNLVNFLVKKIMVILGLLPFLLFVYFEPEYIFLVVNTPIVLLAYFLSVTWLRKIRKMKEKHTWSLQIMNKLLDHCSDQDMLQRIRRTPSEQLSISLRREEFNESESMATPLSDGITIETPLMIAAKNGVVEMVERILEIFPSRIKDVNAEGKNIVLLVVEYRQTEVFSFLCKQKWLSQSLFGLVDKEGNNALHLAASLGVDTDWFIPGEIKWFELVKNSMPRGLSERYNRKMKTPEDVFRESHKELMRTEGEWVAKTSKACSVVSTLVLSLTFAARTSVPSRDNFAFQGFSFLALVFSLISTIIFLSVVVSRSQVVTLKLFLAMYFMVFSIVCLWGYFWAAGSFTDNDDRQTSSTDLSFYIFFSFGIFLSVFPQPTFFGPILSSISPISPRRRKAMATGPIEYRKTKNNEDSTDLNH